MSKFVLSLDQGTTSCRSILWNHAGEIIAVSQREITQYFPQPGWVEHDAQEIWKVQSETIDEVLTQAGAAVEELVSIGVTNQRETVVVWDRATGEPVYPAIVWQDRRTAEMCQQLKNAGLEGAIAALTGLRLDPYFSATKVRWILENVDGVRVRAEAGELCMGTMDSWLVWRLTQGAVHVTDATNASRTLLYNIHVGEWDAALLREFAIPASMLPQIVDSSGEVGKWRGVPIAGIAGDQQAALFGQACTEPGMAKNTYGTGCFMLLHTGDRVVQSHNHLLSTVALQIDGKRTYALEGSVFVGGSLFQWLRDGLGLVRTAQEVDALGASVESSEGVVVVPALAGLGAPHWDPLARGSITGLSRGTGKAHICRAALEAVSFQCVELLECMQRDSSAQLTELRVDGGAAQSDILMQIQANLMGCDVVRPTVTETTAYGVAALAGLAVGFWQSPSELSLADKKHRRFTPQMAQEQKKELRALWDQSVKVTLARSE